jgi:PPOX class probable F420-dependent enzyme
MNPAPTSPSAARAFELSERMRAFLRQPNYATLATLGEDGTPHQAVIWFRLEDDDRILVNSRAGRRWPRELQADPRCALAVTARDDPYTWVGLQAEVDEVIDDVERARDDIVALSKHYGDHSPEGEARFRSQPRISFKLRIVGAHDHLDDD